MAEAPYAQRCKGLARAARHDQLAAIVIIESAGHVVERDLLMGAQAERLVPKGKVFRFIVDQVGPVERPTSEIAEPQHGACGLQWSNGLDGVRPCALAPDRCPRERPSLSERGNHQSYWARCSGCESCVFKRMSSLTFVRSAAASLDAPCSTARDITSALVSPRFAPRNGLTIK